MNDDELRDMASGACQEALAFGVSEDAFMRLARSVRAKCAAECRTMASALRIEDGGQKRAGAADLCADTILGA